MDESRMAQTRVVRKSAGRSQGEYRFDAFDFEAANIEPEKRGSKKKGRRSAESSRRGAME
jgi:hypothetical protein